MDTIVRVVEDTLLAAAEPNKTQGEWQEILTDLAARLYLIAGLDTNEGNVRGQVWTPDSVSDLFVEAIKRDRWINRNASQS